jgi:hypothetical protein
MKLFVAEASSSSKPAEDGALHCTHGLRPDAT